MSPEPKVCACGFQKLAIRFDRIATRTSPTRYRVYCLRAACDRKADGRTRAEAVEAWNALKSRAPKRKAARP